MVFSRALLQRSARLASSLRSRFPSTIRHQSTKPASSAPSTREFYGNFGSPFFKTFLSALFTYQVLYFGWLKLEKFEYEKEKTEELQGLQEEVKRLTEKKSG